MNVAGVVNGTQLGKLLRPEQPYHRDTILRWTIDGTIPREAVVHRGRKNLYLVARLIAAGYLVAPSPASA